LALGAKNPILKLILLNLKARKPFKSTIPRVETILIKKNYKETAKNKLKYRRKKKPTNSNIGAGEAITVHVEYTQESEASISACVD
jgi:hypothetical protein